MSRKSTPDLLGEIMGSTQTNGNKAIKQESNKAIKQESNKAIKPESNKAIKHEQPAVSQDDPKEKATFNLSISLLQQIEDAWVKLKRSGKDKRITKTLIVETAVRKALQDYEENGEDCDLFRSL